MSEVVHEVLRITNPTGGAMEITRVPMAGVPVRTPIRLEPGETVELPLALGTSGTVDEWHWADEETARTCPQ